MDCKGEALGATGQGATVSFLNLYVLFQAQGPGMFLRPLFFLCVQLAQPMAFSLMSSPRQSKFHVSEQGDLLPCAMEQRHTALRRQ